MSNHPLKCPVCDPPGPGDIDGEGYLLGENGEQIGNCNSCGGEAVYGQNCCSDGEIVPIQ